MILRFPSLDVLRLALTSGIIPETVRASAAPFGFEDDQAVWVELAAHLGDAELKDLNRLGVLSSPQSKITLPWVAADWLQMFPLQRDPQALETGNKTPVLFELTHVGQLAEVASEILRLGNDRQSFRWLSDGGDGKALLRVVGPPYFALLRALDRMAAPVNGTQSPVAYREVAPHVWIEMGYRHPLAELVRAPAGQLVLLRAPHRWTFLPEAKWRDIYEVIDFQLPVGATAWQNTELPAHLSVSVKLTRSGATEAAELWLLREEGIAQLDDLVHSADNELLARLAFAVGEKDGARIVVLRARPSKMAPPVLVIEGLAFRSYLRIPNLFLPTGTALHPPLRRDAVVKLLAGDNARITWLVPATFPRGEGRTDLFTPESLPDDAFRPLTEWVDYVLEHAHASIRTWVGESQFDFASFICKDDIAKEKKPPREPGRSN